MPAANGKRQQSPLGDGLHAGFEPHLIGWIAATASALSLGLDLGACSDQARDVSMGEHGGTRPGVLRCSGATNNIVQLHFDISIDPVCGLVLVTRTPHPYDGPAEILRAFDAVERVTTGEIDRSMYKFLGDTRWGPSRNDPSFEGVLKLVRPKLLGGYAKCATLTQTVAGRLQVRRYAQQDGREMLVTSEPSEAFEYLGVEPHPLRGAPHLY